MRCPAQFCELRSEFVLDPHVQTNVRLAFFYFIEKKLWPIFMFSDRCLSEKKKTSLTFVAWCMIDTVSKNHISTFEIEQGIANSTTSALWLAQLIIISRNRDLPTKYNHFKSFGPLNILDLSWPH